jgi:hypothetical protein
MVLKVSNCVLSVCYHKMFPFAGCGQVHYVSQSNEVNLDDEYEVPSKPRKLHLYHVNPLTAIVTYIHFR